MLPASLSEFDANPPALQNLVLQVQAKLGTALPHDYVQFMMRANGGEGPVGAESYLILWKLEELDDFNRDYEVKQYCADLLLFGSSGGGEAYGFSTRTTPYRVVQVPFVGMDESLVEIVGESFNDFLHWLAEEGNNS